MAIYTITTTNWNDPAFWSAIIEAAAGHTLDFSSLTSTYNVSISDNNTIIISDGVTTFTVGDSTTATAVDATLGGTTEFEFFDPVLLSAGDDTVYGDTGDETIDLGNGANHYYDGAGSDRVTGGTGNDSFYVSEDDGTNNVFDGGLGYNLLYLQCTCEGQSTLFWVQMGVPAASRFLTVHRAHSRISIA